MTIDPAVRCAGPIAMVGSGEYLPQMDEVDRLLLAQVGGSSAHVVVLATAAGLEDPSSPQRWSRMGIRHFTDLGVTVNPVDILVRDDAFDSRWLPLLEAADFIYFSGGNPRHLIDTMRGSPAWDTIVARHAAGAVLAGCSAGAMAFGTLTLQPRRLWSTADAYASNGDVWQPALGLAPRVVVLPHFDRWLSRMSEEILTGLAASLPPGIALIGVDEDTALVSLDGCAASHAAAVWHVLGRQGVSIIDPQRGQIRHTAGARITLGGTTLAETTQA